MRCILCFEALLSKEGLIETLSCVKWILAFGVVTTKMQISTVKSRNKSVSEEKQGKYIIISYKLVYEFFS